MNKTLLLGIVSYINILGAMPEDDALHGKPLVAQYYIGKQAYQNLKNSFKQHQDSNTYDVKKHWNDCLQKTISFWGRFGNKFIVSEQKKMLNKIQRWAACTFEKTYNCTSLVGAINRITGRYKILHCEKFQYNKPYAFSVPDDSIKIEKNGTECTIFLSNQQSFIGFESKKQLPHIQTLLVMRRESISPSYDSYKNEDRESINFNKEPRLLFGTPWKHLQRLTITLYKDNLEHIFPYIPTLTLLFLRIPDNTNLTIDASDFTKLPHLKRLLIRSSLSENLPRVTLANTKNREDLTIDHLFFMRCIVSGIKNFTHITPQLKELYVEKSDEHDINFVKNLPKLQLLVFKNSGITNIKNVFNNSTNLQYIFLNNNTISDYNIDELKKFKNLKILNLENNSLTNTQKEELRQLKTGYQVDVRL